MRFLLCIVFSCAFSVVSVFLVRFLDVDQFLKGLICGVMPVFGSFVGSQMYDELINHRQKH